MFYDYDSPDEDKNDNINGYKIRRIDEEDDVDTIIKRIEREFIANRRTRKQPLQQK